MTHVEHAERQAEALIAFIVANGLCHAQCAEDPSHSVVVTWRADALEHLAAHLASLRLVLAPHQLDALRHAADLLDSDCFWRSAAEVRAVIRDLEEVLS